MQVATQYIAYKLNYHKALGDYWFIAFNIVWYPCWNFFFWDFSNAQHIISKGREYGQIVFIIPQGIVLSILLYYAKPKGNAKLHGSAAWATLPEIKTMGYLNGKGVYVGGFQKTQNSPQLYLRHNGPEHLLCFAPTRSGKGVGLILPTLLSWLGSSIVLDIKGENWALTSGYCKSQGHTVLRFDPSDITGSGCKFNPIEEIRLDTLFAIQDVQGMAMMLVDPDGKGLADHWSKAAFAFFAGMMLHCCIMTKSKHKRAATMEDLMLMMSGFEKSVDELLDEMVGEDHSEILSEIFPHITGNQAGIEAHKFIASSAMEMKGKAENEASGVISSALVNLALYRDPIINLNTSSSDFKIADLMNSDKPVNLYLVFDVNSMDRAKPLIRLIIDMIIRRVCKEMAFKDGTSVAGYKHRLLFMFDEFTAFGKLPIIEKAIAYIAGYGGKMYLIVQDIGQLNEVYGKENALMANCHVRIAYAPNKLETGNLLSEMTGKTTVVDKKTSISYAKGGRSRSVSISETARALLTPDECMRLPSAEKDAQDKIIRPGHMLIFTAGQSPIYGVQILYFRDSVFLERAKIPAPGISKNYPSGITDSLYYPRPHEWYGNGKIEKEKVPETIIVLANQIEETPSKIEKTVNFEDYLE